MFAVINTADWEGPSYGQLALDLCYRDMQNQHFFFFFFNVIFIHNQYQIKWTDYSRQRINTYINTEIKFETGYSFPLA